MDEHSKKRNFRAKVRDEKVEYEVLENHRKSSNPDQMNELDFGSKGKWHGRQALNVTEFRIEKADEITVGSQFHATREDELNNSTIFHTTAQSKGNNETFYEVTRKMEKPTATRSFEEMDLVDIVCNRLKQRYPEGPTAIQALAIPTIIEVKRDFVIRAPTGSGKTAAFLAPIINQIQLEKATFSDANGNNDSTERVRGTKDNKVYAIIICPVRDLAVQLTKEARDLSEGTDVKVAFVVGECSIADSVSFIKKEGCDIVIGTLGRLSHFIFTEPVLNIENLFYFVADEADSLERLAGFVSMFEQIKNQSKDNQMQVILASATLGFESNLQLRDPIHIYVKDDMPPPTLVHGFVDLSRIPNSIADDPNLPKHAPSKISYLLTFFKQHVRRIDEKGFKRVPKTIVYVNGKRKVDAIAIFLLKKGFLAYSFHGTKTMLQRSSTIERMKNNEIDIIIATNVLARGLNLTIEYVINYDLPTKCTNYVEFVHRIGRTARVGNFGIAFTMFDPRIDHGFAPYLKKMLEYYELPVPAFIGDSVHAYLSSLSQMSDQYVKDELKRNSKKLTGTVGIMTGRSVLRNFKGKF